MSRNKEYIKGYDLCRKLTRESVSLYDYMDEHDVEWSKHFMIGWLDAISQYYLDLKADTTREATKIDNEILELKQKYREIDKDDDKIIVTTSLMYPNCPSCGNYAWSPLDDDQVICMVCGSILRTVEVK